MTFSSRWSAVSSFVFCTLIVRLNADCPRGYDAFRRNCYKILDIRVTWDGAKRACEREGWMTRLATVDDMAEFTFLKNFVQSQQGHLQANTDVWSVVWVGANDFGEEGNFHWISNYQAVNSDMWAVHQPDDHEGREDCVGFFLRTSDNKLNDQNCRLQQPALCERRRVWIR